MYDGYSAIASAYDRFNADVDYIRWSEFLEACFERFLPARPEIVLDLACGTGRMTFPLADRGYDMIGIDPDGTDTDAAMEALSKHPAPLFLQQDMRDFELYGTVDATVCCLDSLNYLCGDGDLLACLKCIYLYLAPGGLLVFDVNSPYKFAHTYGNNAYILEDEDEDGRAVFCGWQNAFDPESRLCKFYLSLFSENEEGVYVRSDEEQTERCFDEAELRSALDEAGFDLCGMYADFDFSPVTDTTERWYVVARTRKVGDWYLCKDTAPNS